MTLEEHLASADELLSRGDALGALNHIAAARVLANGPRKVPKRQLARLAGLMIDGGSDIKDEALVAEGFEILQRHYSAMSRIIQQGSLEYNMGNAQKSLHDLEAAKPGFVLRPESVVRLTEAKDHYWRSLKLGGDSEIAPEIRINLANALDQCGRVAEALRWYDSAIALSPRFGMAHLNRGLGLLAVNRISGRYSVRLVSTALQSFRAALDDSALPKHLQRKARQYEQALIRQRLKMGWDEDRVALHADRQTAESAAHDEYWRFCLSQRLALCEHALYCSCAGARRDDLTITYGKGIGGRFVPVLELLLNRVKSEYCAARSLYFRCLGANTPTESVLHEGTYSELGDDEALGLGIEYLRTSFRLCFGVLDRIAHGINELYELATTDEVLYFESFWRPSSERKRGREDRWGRLNTGSNLGLVALYSIATDLNREGGEWGFFKEYRNDLEHGLLILTERSSVLPERVRPLRIRARAVPRATFEIEALHMLQLTASAIFSFVFCVRTEARRRAGARADPVVLGKKPIGKA